MMTDTGSFDVVAVVARAAAMPVSGASVEELAWADRAADRIRIWVDAWQAQVQFEQTLPRPLPPHADGAGPDPTPGRNTDERGDAGGAPGAGGAGDGGPTRGSGSGPDGESAPGHAGDGSSGGGASGGDDQTSRGPDHGAGGLPSLGPAFPAPESAADQARKARRSWLLSCLSAFAEALRAGRITTGHVDTLANATERLPQPVRDRVIARGEALLRDALVMTPERFSRAVAKAVSKAYDDEGIDRHAALRSRAGMRRGIDQATRMHWYRFELDPDRGVVLDAKLRAVREALFHGGGHSKLRTDQLELLALLNLIDADHTVAPSGPASALAPDRGNTAWAGAAGGRDVPGSGTGTSASTTGTAHHRPAPSATDGAAVVGAAEHPPTPGGASPPRRARRRSRAAAKQMRGLVLIDATTWLHGIHDGTVCENGAGVPLPPDTVRRLLCIAEITYGILIDGRLVAQVAGNELATPDQRDGLRGMYRTCAGPGCTRIFDHCQIHHIIARARNGPTDIALMIPLCQEHHDALHHRGWQVAIDPKRDLTWTDPDGRQIFCPYVPLADLDRRPTAPAGGEQLHLFGQRAHPPPPAA